MSASETDGWATRAQRLLSEGRRHNGAARQALLDLLDSQPCALSAVEMEDLLRAGHRPVGRASIYRILEELERLNLVQRVQVGQSMARYEPVRSEHEHHHHLVCDSCGTVMPFTDPDLEQAIKTLSGRVPMRVDEHEIVLHGSCDECA
ncbi:MAG TPA: transcriptional repressor [Solirubrobacteraceae bacterium]|nr:transcriptional repressor [Solirubrobacteraceae bacterium]